MKRTYNLKKIQKIISWFLKSFGFFSLFTIIMNLEVSASLSWSWPFFFVEFAQSSCSIPLHVPQLLLILWPILTNLPLRHSTFSLFLHVWREALSAPAKPWFNGERSPFDIYKIKWDLNNHQIKEVNTPHSSKITK